MGSLTDCLLQEYSFERLLCYFYVLLMLYYHADESFAERPSQVLLMFASKAFKSAARDAVRPCSPLSPLLEIRVNTAVSNSVHFQLEPQARTIHDHLKCEVEVVEFHPPRRRQPSEQAARNGVEIRR